MKRLTLAVLLILATQNIYSGPTCSRPEIINEQSQENINTPQALPLTDQEVEEGLMTLQYILNDLPTELSDKEQGQLSELLKDFDKLSAELRDELLVEPVSPKEKQLIAEISEKLRELINPQVS